MIDDPHFLFMARQILNHPLHPMDFTICWNITDACQKAYDLTAGNTLMGYALAPIVAAGSKEWMAHLLQLFFAWFAAGAMASLMLRYGWSRVDARLGALAFVAVPPFLPLASTAMPDILATALATFAMERLAAWKNEGRWTQAIAAACALGLAGVARAHLALMLPLALVFLRAGSEFRGGLPRLRETVRNFAPVLIGGAILAAAILATRERGLALEPPAALLQHGNSGLNLRSFLLYLSIPFPLYACWCLCRLKQAPWRVMGAVLLSIAAGFSSHSYSVFFATGSLCMLCDLFVEAIRRRDREGFLLLLWVLLPLTVVPYMHLPVKYLLPCAPAIVLICFRLGRSVGAHWFRLAWTGMLAVATVFSVLILRSDAEFARFGRDAMTALIQPHVAVGERVWYAEDFSAYWYAPIAGAQRLIRGESQPKPGDLIVDGVQESGQMILTHFPNRTLVQSIRHHYTFGRTMYQGIGLYTDLEGYWLWGFGNSDRDRYELWRIN